MPSTNKLPACRTTFETDGERGSVTCVNTRIVSWDADTVTLDSAGWQTVTTRRKMVQAANRFGPGFTVARRNGEWFVIRLGRSPDGYASAMTEHGAVTLPYHDGISFPKGTVRPVSVAA